MIWMKLNIIMSNDKPKWSKKWKHYLNNVISNGWNAINCCESLTHLVKINFMGIVFMLFAFFMKNNNKWNLLYIISL